jgi:hypothetical protein
MMMKEYRMTRARHLPAAALIATALLVTACHKKGEAPANGANITEELPPEPLPTENVANAPIVAPVPEKALATPDTSKLSEEEQVREDAEATGMTSRTTPGEPAATNVQ